MNEALRQSLGLEGVHNARELGGYRTVDGRTVRHGVLIRTAQLSDATEADWKKLLEDYQLSLAIDLRTSVESNRHPDPKIPGVDVVALSPLGVNLPLIFSRLEKNEDMTPEELDDYRMRVVYEQLGSSKHARRVYQKIIRLLLEADGKTVLWHCTEGKDRTGIVAVLILSLLGVDRETCIQDYLLTNDYFPHEPDAEDDLDRPFCRQHIQPGPPRQARVAGTGADATGTGIRIHCRGLAPDP